MEITQHARYTCTFCGKVSEHPMSTLRSDSQPVTGLREAHGRWHLALQIVQENYRWRCMDGIDHRSCYHTEVGHRTLSALRFSNIFRSTIRRLRDLTEA